MQSNYRSAVILAAGLGTRMKSNISKQHIVLSGMTILRRTILAFESAKLVDEIIVVAKRDEIELAHEALYGISKPSRVVVGGENRAESARRGFEAISSQSNIVAIHDAARCLIAPGQIDDVILLAEGCGAASMASRVTDTIKRIDGNGNILETIPRDDLMRAETPQVFDVELYRRAIKECDIPSELITDDNMLVEAIGANISLLDSGGSNLKITTGIDLKVAELLLSGKADSE